VSLGGLTGTLKVFEGWSNNMAIKPKFLIVWIIAAIVAAFLARHFLGCLTSSLENFIACDTSFTVTLGKFAAAFFTLRHS